MRVIKGEGRGGRQLSSSVTACKTDSEKQLALAVAGTSNSKAACTHSARYEKE